MSPIYVGCIVFPDVAKVDFTAREFQIGRFLRVGCFKMLNYGFFAVVKEKQEITAYDFEFYGCTYGQTERYNMILYITLVR